MRIGEVSELVGIPIENIRYYIKRGLILPAHTSYQYRFDEHDIAELTQIRKYKKLGFSLDEIHDILSLFRVSYVSSSREVTKMLSFLHAKRRELEDRQFSLTQSITDLDELIRDVESQGAARPKTAGFSLHFLSLLGCGCGHDFRLVNATLESGLVLSGELQCTNCGKSMHIHDGVIYAVEDEEPNKNTLFNIAHTLLEDYDASAIDRFKLDEQALSDIIPDKENVHGKVILETNIRKWFFLLKNTYRFPQDNCYILVEEAPEIVEYYKAQLDLHTNSGQFLFIVAKPGGYPLKKASVDLWVDYMDSTDHHEINTGALPQILSPYLKARAQIYGMHLMVSKDYFELLVSRHPLLDRALVEYLGPGMFEKHLEEAGFDLIFSRPLREAWESSKSSNVLITKNPPIRCLYAAVKR